MADLKRKDLFNQTRKTATAVFALTEAEILADALVATLPHRVLVTAVETIVTTASTTSGSQVTVKVGAVAIATNVAVSTTGVKTTATPGYFATGGDITVVAGTTAPAADNLVCEVVVHYVDLDCTTGMYIS